MISAEDFLRNQGLQSDEVTVEGPAHVLEDAGDAGSCSNGVFAEGGKRCGRTPRSRHSRHAQRVGNENQDVEFDPNDFEACRESALRLLDAAPRSSGTLRERLLGKGYGPYVVEDVIERLVDVQLIDDEAYAYSAVRYCVSRMLGRRATMMELGRKGVDRALARRVCDEAEASGMFTEAAWELGRRTVRKTSKLDPEVRRRRFWGAGGRKGHDPEILREVARELF
jgi:regulatory protein